MSSQALETNFVFCGQPKIIISCFFSLSFILNLPLWKTFQGYLKVLFLFFFLFSVLYLQYLELTVPIQILFQTVAFHKPFSKRMSFLIASKKLSLNFSDLERIYSNIFKFANLDVDDSWQLIRFKNSWLTCLQKFNPLEQNTSSFPRLLVHSTCLLSNWNTRAPSVL